MPTTSRRVRFKAVIEDSKPPLWRVLEVDADLPLDGLHIVLQIAFGWQGYHLHEFSTAKAYRRTARGGAPAKRWGPPAVPGSWTDEGSEVLDERRARVGRFLFETTSPVFYIYDFGDEWHVRLDLVESRVVDPGAPTALAVKAKLRGPTEDSGGIWGWEEKREVLQDPSHPEYKELSAWMREVDPDRWPITDVVDLDALNDELAEVFDRPEPEA